MAMAMPISSNSLLLGLLILSCVSGGSKEGAIVTLESIEIFQTHEVLKSIKPDVYFHCTGENETHLPDVKIPNHFYTFKPQQSWQPLTELSENKCKRCGFYEKDVVFGDDKFDEWEFCALDFSKDGKYTRFKDKEVNATFSCPQCIPFVSDSNAKSGSREKEKEMHVAVIILISVLVSTVVIIGLIAAHKYWQKKKRQQDQARFLKLFEDGDDIEDELGLGNVL